MWRDTLRLWIDRYKSVLVQNRRLDEQVRNLSSALTVALALLTDDQLAEMERRLNDRRGEAA